MRRSTHHPKVAFSLDLHVLGTPPAFILSQNQTLQFKFLLTIAIFLTLTRYLIVKDRRSGKEEAFSLTFRPCQELF